MTNETIAPYKLQQDGVAERKKCILKDMMNAILVSSSLSDNMWGEAILTACLILTIRN